MVTMGVAQPCIGSMAYTLLCSKAPCICQQVNMFVAFLGDLSVGIQRAAPNSVCVGTTVHPR